MARRPMREATALLEPSPELELVRRDRAPEEGVPRGNPSGLAILPRADQEPATFEAFFQAESPRLVRAMFLVTGDRHEAEEITQDAFVRACERWDLVSPAANRPGYVYRMALNGYRSKLRRLARGARKTLRPPEEPDLFAAVDDRDAFDRVIRSVHKRRRRRRAVASGTLVCVLATALTAVVVAGHSQRPRARVPLAAQLLGTTQALAVRNALGIEGPTKGAPESVVVTGRTPAGHVEVSLV